MADTSKATRSTTPPRLPDTTPPNVVGIDHSFTLQTIMELQKTVAQMVQAVTTLSEQSKEHDRKLEESNKELRDKIELIGKDVHAGRMSLKVAAWIIGFFMTLLTLIWAIASKLIHL